jgi:hypothetical protein
MGKRGNLVYFFLSFPPVLNHVLSLFQDLFQDQFRNRSGIQFFSLYFLPPIKGERLQATVLSERKNWSLMADY